MTKTPIIGSKYRSRPILTVDVVVFTLLQHQLHVLLIQRERAPFAGQLVLPGAFVHIDEDADCADAAKRLTRDKLGAEIRYLEQLQTFSGATRDPRGWSASVVHLAMIPASYIAALNTQEFYPVDNLPALGFDHNEIVEAAIARVRNKTSYSSLPLFLMPEKFTIYELQAVYESLLRVAVNKTTFRSRMIEQGIVEPTGEMQKTSLHRPAELYRSSGSLSIFREIR